MLETNPAQLWDHPATDMSSPTLGLVTFSSLRLVPCIPHKCDQVNSFPSLTLILLNSVLCWGAFPQNYIKKQQWFPIHTSSLGLLAEDQAEALHCFWLLYRPASQFETLCLTFRSQVLQGGSIFLLGICHSAGIVESWPGSKHRPIFHLLYRGHVEEKNSTQITSNH